MAHIGRKGMAALPSPAMTPPLLPLILNLPQDVIFKIFSRLPIKSLLQIKSVCKLWLSQISSPNFITTHFNHTAHQQNSVSLIFHRLDKTLGREVMSLIHLDSDKSLVNLTPPNLPKSREKRISLNVVGCCNGIVCLTSTWIHGVTCLWNPATRQAKRLASPTFNEDVVPSIGFGYDPNSDDYKVVRIKNYVEVYSTNADAWGEVKAVEKSVTLTMLLSKFDTCVRGVLYWRIHAEEKLMAFDLQDEVFQQIQLPSCVGENRRVVVNFRDSVAMIVYCGCDREVGLWVVDDQKKSWTKQFKFGIDPTVSFHYPSRLIFEDLIKNGEIVANEGIWLSMIDKSQTEEYKKIHYDVVGSFGYNESLVSFKGSVQVHANDDANEERNNKRKKTHSN